MTLTTFYQDQARARERVAMLEHQADALWQGDRDELVPVDVDQAYQMYERLKEKRVPVHEAFPDIVIEDA